MPLQALPEVSCFIAKLSHSSSSRAIISTSPVSVRTRCSGSDLEVKRTIQENIGFDATNVFLLLKLNLASASFLRRLVGLAFSCLRSMYNFLL
jgi:hypothetical protein